MRRILLTAALTAFAARGVAAQTCDINNSSTGSVSCSVNTTVSMTVPSLMHLDMTGFTSGTNLALTVPGLNDYPSSGLFATYTGGISLTVKANRSWQVQIQAATATFTGAAYSKPASDLSWGVGGVSGSFVELTTTPESFFAGSATAGSAASNLTYKVAFDITKDVPGTYNLGITYTLIAP